MSKHVINLQHYANIFDWHNPEARFKEYLANGGSFLAPFKMRTQFCDILDDCNVKDHKEYHEWVIWWKENYKALSKLIRILKNHRKYQALRPYTNDLFRTQYKILETLKVLRELAKMMMESRMEYKQNRKDFKLESLNEAV